MSDMIGAPRYYVEEMLGRSGLALKKEVEDGDKIICYYGYPSKEEGHLEYIYDSDEELVSYKKLTEVIAKQANEIVSRNLDIFVKVGTDRAEVEKNIKKYMLFIPLGKEETSQIGVSQTYGMKNYDTYEPVIIVYYDHLGKVLDRKLIK